MNTWNAVFVDKKKKPLQWLFLCNETCFYIQRCDQDFQFLVPIVEAKLF